MTMVVAVIGPTAAGKSDLAVSLAHRFDGEVINADSMQLYRGMDIGTAKLSAAERQGVPHHLLDIWDPRHPADVATYQRLARRQIDEVLAVGRLPIVVGGSGLYVRAALDVMEFPGTDPVVRGRLEAELAELGPALLHARLAGLDPAAAAAILPGNGRRLVRALEVVELTGSFSAQLPAYASAYDAVFLGVDRRDLDERIAVRTQRMWDAGFVDEVVRLADAGLREGRTASRALGYAQVLQWLDGALGHEAEAQSETTRLTCKFVRRQRSWFRRDPRIHWLPEQGNGGADRHATFGRPAQFGDAERLIAAAGLR